MKIKKLQAMKVIFTANEIASSYVSVTSAIVISFKTLFLDFSQML